jgi:DNA-binding CsgD family transcriptional regulator
MALTAETRPTSPPAYRAVLLVRPDAWATVERWIPTSGLTIERVPCDDGGVPRLELGPAPTGRATAVLSARELDVLRLAAAGYENVQIAALLFVSKNTVKTHAKAIYRKLGARGRPHAIHIAHQRGLLEGAAA